MNNRNIPSEASGSRGASRVNWRLRGAAIRKGLIVPHPIPGRLVKDENGSWVEGAWIQEK